MFLKIMMILDIIILTIVSLIFIFSLSLFLKWCISPILFTRKWNSLKIHDIYRYTIVDVDDRYLKYISYYALIDKTDVERKMVTLQNIKTGNIIRVSFERFINEYEKI